MTPDEKEMQERKISLMITAILLACAWGITVIILLAIIASK